MVNKKLLMGTLIMLLVFGMAVIGCDDSTNDKDTIIHKYVNQSSYPVTITIDTTNTNSTIVGSPDRIEFTLQPGDSRTITFEINMEETVELLYDWYYLPDRWEVTFTITNEGNTNVYTFINYQGRQ